LAGQLINRYALWDCAPGRMLPEHTFTPEGFQRVLSRAAQCARQAGHPLVMVMDGADEADPVEGLLPWGLPLDLPAGVFVVGTYRTGFAPTGLHTSRVVVHLNPDDPRNHRDVALHLDTVLREEALAARLAAAGVGRDAFIAEITARCGGV